MKYFLILSLSAASNKETPASVTLNDHVNKILDIDQISINIVASIAFAFIAVVSRWVVWILYSKFEKDRMFGEWNHYFVNLRNSKPVFIKDKMIINKGFWHRMSVKSHNENNISGSYSGYAKRERNFLILHTKVKGDDETIFQRFFLPPMGSRDLLIGVASAQDYDGRASSHIAMISKEDINYDEFLEIVKNRTKFNLINRISTLL